MYCATCRFFQENHCHRFPPTVHASQIKTEKGILVEFVDNVTKVESKYPYVTKKDWCGEWVDNGP